MKKYFIGFLAIIVLVGGGYFAWSRYFSPGAKYRRQTEKQVEAYQKWEDNYKQAMTEDTYGGKTPQETLQMFIAALEKGDIDLASKYFMLDTNEQPYNKENYLTRKKWEEGLRTAEKEGRIQNILNELSQAVPTKDQSSVIPDTYWFSVYDKNGDVAYDIELQFNKYSGVWKIESL